MLRFFRDIRHRLLMPDNVRKYLLYAAGEILLVVLGILIALQVNNWNEYRKERQLEVEVLKEISSDLSEDIRSLENDIRINKFYIQNIQTIHSALESIETYPDSLSMYFGRLTFNTTYTLKRSGYNNLQNQGFEIVANDSVRRAITNLYDSAYSFLKESQATSDRLTFEVFTPAYIRYFKRIDSEVRTNQVGRSIRYTPKDYQMLRTDEEFKLLLDFLAQIKVENLYSIDLALSQLQETMSTVEAYLMELED